MKSIRLGEIAYARSGDKGSSANVGVIARSPNAFVFLRDTLTAGKVQAYFEKMSVGQVIRYELPNLAAFNFILPNILLGGGSISPRIDAQGKALGQMLLEMNLDVPDDLFANTLAGEETMNDLVLVDSTDPQITVLTLNRPDKRNALSIELIEQLTRAVRDASADRNRRVLVIRGGGPSFCAGLDLQEATDPTKARGLAVGLFNLYNVIATTPLITIAAPHGAAMGGGAGLVAACDLVVAAEDLKLAYPEVRRGLVAALVTALLRRQFPERIVRELVLLAQTVDAPRAVALGLANRIGTFDDALELAHEACRGAPGAIARSKRLLDTLAPRPVEEDLKRALDFHLQARESSEAAEGMAAFLEKREPKWGPREL